MRRRALIAFIAPIVIFWFCSSVLMAIDALGCPFDDSAPCIVIGFDISGNLYTVFMLLGFLPVVAVPWMAICFVGWIIAEFSMSAEDE